MITTIQSRKQSSHHEILLIRLIRFFMGQLLERYLGFEVINLHHTIRRQLTVATDELIPGNSALIPEFTDK